VSKRSRIALDHVENARALSETAAQFRQRYILAEKIKTKGTQIEEGGMVYDKALIQWAFSPQGRPDEHGQLFVGAGTTGDVEVPAYPLPIEYVRKAQQFMAAATASLAISMMEQDAKDGMIAAQRLTEEVVSELTDPNVGTV